jgi:hypothetical protein
MDFPISASDLPWWGWILCAIGCWILVAGETIAADEEWLPGPLAIPAVILTGLVGVICAVIGVVRLVKWAWAS